MVGRPPVPAAVRFAAKVARGAGCWLWQGRPGADGYGQFRVGVGTTKAHRFSYELHKGPVPPGLHVLHKCDVRLCVNPEHLFLGTALTNMRDMIAKGRKRVCFGAANARFGKPATSGFSGHRHTEAAKEKMRLTRRFKHARS